MMTDASLIAGWLKNTSLLLKPLSLGHGLAVWMRSTKTGTADNQDIELSGSALPGPTGIKALKFAPGRAEATWSP